MHFFSQHFFLDGTVPLVHVVVVYPSSAAIQSLGIKSEVIAFLIPLGSKLISYSQTESCGAAVITVRPDMLTCSFQGINHIMHFLF